MSQAPPGWYADPEVAPGQQPGMRWWDGTRWTTHVAPGALATSAGPTGKATTTPDGQPLAGWGARLGAYLIDAFLTFTVTVVVGFPFVRSIVRSYAEFIDKVIDASEQGRQPPSTFAIYGDVWLPLVGLGVVSLVVGLAYHAGFLRWKAATPGKLAVGLRVRLWDGAGPLPWGVIARRWAAQYGVALLGVVPVVGSVTGLYSFLDGLWPLWDDRRQAIHDKFARTSVVRIR